MIQLSGKRQHKEQYKFWVWLQMPRLGIYPGYFRSNRKAGQQSFTAAGLHLGLSWQRERRARSKAVSLLDLSEHWQSRSRKEHPRNHPNRWRKILCFRNHDRQAEWQKLCHHLGIAYAEPVYANPEKRKRIFLLGSSLRCLSQGLGAIWFGSPALSFVPL